MTFKDLEYDKSENTQNQHLRQCPICNEMTYPNRMFCYHCGKRINGKARIGGVRTHHIIIAVVVVSILLIAFRLIMLSLERNARYTSLSSTANSKSFDYEKDGLLLVSAKWEKGGFGVVAVWHVTIENISDKPLGNIKFRTRYISETGRTVGYGGVDAVVGKDTIEKLIPPGDTRTFEVNDGFISDEAAKAYFEIVSWQIITREMIMNGR